jgi:ATP-dependent DNA helicase RecG
MDSQLLKTPVEYLKGIGPQRAASLKKELGIATYQDLLTHFPFRYIDRTRFYKIRELNDTLPYVQLVARVVSREIVGEKSARRLVAQVKDDTGSMELVWFQGIRWADQLVKAGSAYVIFGKPNLFNGRISISHPELEIYDPGAKKTGNPSLQPVYSSTEKLKQSGLDTRGIQRAMAALLDQVIGSIQENLPAAILRENRLTGRQKAYYHIHFPENTSELKAAETRIKFEELFATQLKLLKNKQLYNRKFKGPVFSLVGEKFNSFYTERLPFELTEAQKRVLREIRHDTQRGIQMNRLLQGDVGSGKTVVALMSMLLAIDNGCQACLMAPTEILAKQHEQSLRQLAGEGFITIRLLTGSTKRKERRELHAQLQTGAIDILIGTHALIEEAVQFRNLGLAVIDEQHRFGVEQRFKLWKKAALPPHILVMTATPIPRTLAMTLYGDLDVSVIDELPAGRKPVKTIHLFESQRLRMFGFMRQEMALGRQVYIVYPLIRESEKMDLLHLEAGIEAVAREFPLPGFRISIVHGKMPAGDKDFEMMRFVKGETQIMVATTVIEVGVNVPNATVMVIEHAERFGLSQLHQLRGRVGRGGAQSYCILLTSQKLSREARSRIETMVRTTDGFEIAETDLQLRGPGDIEGTRQSGLLDLKLADLATDQPLLLQARNAVIKVLEADPELSHLGNAPLKSFFEARGEGISWNKIS